MIRIRAISRLMRATHEIGSSTTPSENQVSRIKSRLVSGTDVDGNTFAPYKNPKVKRANSRPLQQAARLFESPQFDNEVNFTGISFKFSITGIAAKIAIYQNFRRRFLGFSRQDRPEVKHDIANELRKAFRSTR
jgi:hypothetical protein